MSKEITKAPSDGIRDPNLPAPEEVSYFKPDPEELLATLQTFHREGDTA